MFGRRILLGGGVLDSFAKKRLVRLHYVDQYRTRFRVAQSRDYIIILGHKKGECGEKCLNRFFVTSGRDQDIHIFRRARLSQPPADSM